MGKRIKSDRRRPFIAAVWLFGPYPCRGIYRHGTRCDSEATHAVAFPVVSSRRRGDEWEEFRTWLIHFFCPRCAAQELANYPDRSDPVGAIPECCDGHVDLPLPPTRPRPIPKRKRRI